MPPSPQTPSKLGRYEILDRLATGGMAEIFLACERGVRGLERLVVVKKILPHLAVQEAFVEMFVQEAKIVARLNHPNVVQIHDLAEAEGEVFISMEYVPGSTLRELTDAAEEIGKIIPVGVAVGIVAQACKGAHAAHELKDGGGRPLGLVHRDISPHNLIATNEGNVKLLDFGIAKATEGLENTATGTLKGKYCYMSPEQARHENLDRRSDVFALGIVLWELLAAERLYKRESELASMNAIVSEDAPPVENRRSDVPAAIAKVLARALARDRNERIATADEFRHGLTDAALAAGMNISEDVVGTFVRELLGDKHIARRAAVDAAVEKTLAQTPDSLEPTRRQRTLLSAQPIREDPTAVERAGAATSSMARLDAPPPLHIAREQPVSRRRAVAVATSAALVGALIAWSALMVTVGPGLFGVHLLDKKPAFSGPPLVVAFPPVMDSALQQRELEPLRLYLQELIGRPVQFPVTRSYDETAERVLKGEYHFGSFPPYLYLKSHQRDPRLRVLAFKLFRGSSGTDGVLLVPETSTAQGLKDLDGKRFCFTDKSSLTGFVLPRAALLSAGLDLAKVDANTRLSGDHLQVLRDLNAGHCEAGATYSGAYLAADRAGVPVARLRVLGITGRSPHDAICSGPAAGTEERQLLLSALLKFNPKEHLGTEMLGEVQQISGFTAGDDGAYDGLRAALMRAGALEPAKP